MDLLMQRRAADIMTVIRRSAAVEHASGAFNPDLKAHCASCESDARSSWMRQGWGAAHLYRDPYAKEFLWRQCLSESSCPEPRDALKDTYEYLKGLYPDKQWEPDPDPRCEACAQVGYLFFGAAHRSTVRGRIVRKAERPSERLVTDTLVGMWQALPAADKDRWAKTRMHTRGGAPKRPRRRRRRKRRFDHGL